MVDNNELDGHFARFQFQAKLICERIHFTPVDRQFRAPHVHAEAPCVFGELWAVFRYREHKNGKDLALAANLEVEPLCQQ